jgi:anti-sigma-K factor RskA
MNPKNYTALEVQCKEKRTLVPKNQRLLHESLAIRYRSCLVRFNRRRNWVLAAAAVSIVSAFAVMVLYKLSDWGPSQPLLRDGVVHYYVQSAFWLCLLKGQDEHSHGQVARP